MPGVGVVLAFALAANSLRSTEVYAKVAVEALRAVAPGDGEAVLS